LKAAKEEKSTRSAGRLFHTLIGLTEIIFKKENKINRKKQQHNTLQTAVQKLGGMNKRTGRDLQDI